MVPSPAMHTSTQLTQRPEVTPHFAALLTVGVSESELTAVLDMMESGRFVSFANVLRCALWHLGHHLGTPMGVHDFDQRSGLGEKR